jgi:molybdopterin converting factor small subunit
MQVQVLPFGQIAEVTGAGKILIDAPDTDALQRILIEKFPELRNKKYAIAVNREVINENTLLPNNAEVALLPPYAGG